MSGASGRHSGRRQPIPRRDPAEIEAHLRNRDRSALDARLRSRERTATGAERTAARERVAERVAPGGAQRGVDRGTGHDVRGRRPSPRVGRRSKRRTWIALASLVSALLVAAVAVPPLAGNLLRALAEQNPDLVRIGFIADAVAEVMDGRPDQPAGTDPTPVDFVIEAGTGSGEITADLLARELVTDALAFTYVLVTEGGINELRAGVHVLNRTMSPRDVAHELQQPPFSGGGGVPVALRDGLRLHQVVAYLQTLPLDSLDIHEFHELAIDPPASLLQEYEWLRVLPEGASLEGFLGAGIFDVDQDIDARGMLGTLLQRWEDSPSSALIAEAEQQGKDFYSVVTLASIVEREAALDREKALIAGVFQNRLDGVGEGRRLLQSDSALIYAKDTMRLRELAIVEWPNFVFWTFDGLPDPQSFETSPDLVGYHTWRTRGLPPGPIATPSLGSIEAALNPDTKDGYLYFLSKLDGSNEHVFAGTYAEHLENIDRYLRGASPTPLVPPTAVPAP